MEIVLCKIISENESEFSRENAECLKCDTCEYKARSNTVLKRHKTMKHKQKTASSSIPCVREVFGCKNKVNEYNDKECAICPDCRSKLEIMFNSSPFSPTLCPCCHDPSGGPPHAFCQECLGYLDQDGCMDSPFGSWNRDNITGDIICINLDFELL